MIVNFTEKEIKDYAASVIEDSLGQSPIYINITAYENKTANVEFALFFLEFVRSLPVGIARKEAKVELIMRLGKEMEKNGFESTLLERKNLIEGLDIW